MSVSQPINPSGIVAACAAYWKVRPAAILGSSKGRSLVTPRFVAAMLIRELCGLSYPEIGRAMNRDHTSVMHAEKRAKELLVNSAPLRDKVHNLRQSILMGEDPNASMAARWTDALHADGGEEADPAGVVAVGDPTGGTVGADRAPAAPSGGGGADAGGAGGTAVRVGYEPATSYGKALAAPEISFADQARSAHADWDEADVAAEVAPWSAASPAQATKPTTATSQEITLTLPPGFEVVIRKIR